MNSSSKTVHISFTNDVDQEYSNEVNSFLKTTISFEFNETTTTGDLFRYIFSIFPEKDAFQYQFDEDLFEHFILKNHGLSRSFNGMDANFSKMIEYIQPANDTLLIYWFSRPGGGFGVLEEDGLWFEIRPKEANHQYTPHVHAKYGKQQISIRIADGELLAGKMNKIKELKARKLVKKNREYLQKQWDECQHGFRIPPRINL